MGLSTAGTSTSADKDWLTVHPSFTTPSGLMDVATSSVNGNLFIDTKEVECLAKNIFFEAAVESTAGRLAVAQVTLNRVNSDKYPNSICKVVYEGPHYSSGHPKRDQCQFSWYCDGRGDEPTVGRLWRESQNLAKYVVLRHEELPDITDGATHYHADYVSPSWAKRKQKTATIDTHIFYKKATYKRL
jgi:spore germination cell wall hydrolase CwlJ-like protein